MRYPPRAVTAAAGLVIMALTGQACTMARISTPQQVHPALENRNTASLARNFERHRRPAQNLRLSATLWDLSLIDAQGLEPAEGHDAVAQAISNAETQAHEEARKERWKDLYLREQTTFTVVVELLNQPRPPQDEDPQLLATPEAWTFTLERDAAEEISPSKIEVHAVDRYPTQLGAWHWRLVYAVHFEGPILRGGDGETPTLTLRVRPPTTDAWRGEYGRRASQAGFPLRWHIL